MVALKPWAVGVMTQRTQGFLLGDTILKLDSGDGCTILWMFVIWWLKWLMSCIFHQNKPLVAASPEKHQLVEDVAQSLRQFYSARYFYSFSCWTHWTRALVNALCRAVWSSLLILLSLYSTPPAASPLEIQAHSLFPQYQEEQERSTARPRALPNLTIGSFWYI